MLDYYEALERLAKLAQVDSGCTQLRSCWDHELAWEQEWFRPRYKGSRGQYQRAVDNTFERMKEWLEGGYLLRENLKGHWLHGEPMGDLELITELANWIGSSRPAAVWCSLQWLRRQLMARNLRADQEVSHDHRPE